MAGRLWHLIRQGLARFRWPLAGLAALMVVLACVLVIPQWLLGWELGAPAHTLTAADRAKAINDVRATLLQGIGGAVILLGAYYTYRQLQTGREQLQIAQQGQVTERFTRAIDQLGHAELDVRLGAGRYLRAGAHRQRLPRRPDHHRRSADRVHPGPCAVAAQAPRPIPRRGPNRAGTRAASAGT